jgi:hypothetical protein
MHTQRDVHKKYTVTPLIRAKTKNNPNAHQPKNEQTNIPI